MLFDCDENLLNLRLSPKSQMFKEGQQVILGGRTLAWKHHYGKNSCLQRKIYRHPIVFNQLAALNTGHSEDGRMMSFLVTQTQKHDSGTLSELGSLTVKFVISRGGIITAVHTHIYLI